MDLLLITASAFETRAALLSSGEIRELFIERKKKKSLVGNIYKGKILKVLPGIESAFLDIGGSRTAFLHISDLFSDGNLVKGKGIESSLAGYRELVVQVTKDPLGDKGARLTTHISIPGRFLVLFLKGSYRGISKKIKSAAKKEELKNLIDEICPAECGLIARTSAEETDRSGIKADLERLLLIKEQIRQGEASPAPRLLYEEDSLTVRLAREFAALPVRVITDDIAAAELFKKYKADTVYYREEIPLFERYKIVPEELLHKEVSLPSGGFIVIEQTEALTVIDVNTGHFVGERNFEETILAVNMEAAKEIARQLVLRNIGGIVVADFIDMADLSHRVKIQAYMEELLALDKGRAQVVGITSLGLMEITRKRARDNLRSVLYEPCPCCKGLGFIASRHTAAYRLLREAEGIASKNRGKSIVITTSGEVAELAARESENGAELKKNYGTEITFISDPSMLRHDCLFTVTDGTVRL